MKYIISIINPSGLNILTDICAELQIPLSLTLHGRGTATKSMLDLLGIESREKRIIMSIANEELTKKLIIEQRRRLYIDAPGNGVIISIPIKSIGGGNTLAYLSGGAQAKNKPELNYNYELILAIVNEGYTDMVMDAARSAGARGGTVLHAKGTGSAEAAKFFNLSIAKEKELVLIVARADEKAAIMTSILTLSGPATDAGAFVFSLPV